MGLPVVFAGLSLAGSFLQASAQRQAGQAEKLAGEFNAQTLEMNADIAIKRSVEDERKFRVLFKQDQGSNRVSIGASGITTEGSAMDVLEQNAREGELAALTIKAAGEFEAFDLRRAAGLSRLGGQASARAAGGAATATLVGASAGFGFRVFGGKK